MSELCALYQNGLWLSACIAKVIGYTQSPGLLNAKGAFEGLELCDGKLSRTVLRGKGGRKAPALPGNYGDRIGITISRHTNQKAKPKPCLLIGVLNST